MLKPGIHRLDADAYHADQFAGQPTLSSTLARLCLDQSPLHAWTAHPVMNPNHEAKDSATFDIGRAAHRAVLGAGGDYAVIPDDLLSANGAVSTKVAKEWVEAARADGLTPVKAEVAERVDQMAARVHDRLDQCKVWLDQDRSELTALGRVDGVLCRAMIDNAPENPALPLYDFKTTMSAAPDACAKAVWSYGYDVQAAHYLDTWEAATGEKRGWRFIFQEKEAPFEVCVVELTEGDLIMARKRIARAREIWANCLTSNHWPGYPAGVHRVELPGWYQERWLERESAEADYRHRVGADILDQARRWQAPHNMEKTA